MGEVLAGGHTVGDPMHAEVASAAATAEERARQSNTKSCDILSGAQAALGTGAAGNDGIVYMWCTLTKGEEAWNRGPHKETRNPRRMSGTKRQPTGEREDKDEVGDTELHGSVLSARRTSKARWTY
jgi:hypothetical protein